MICYGLETEFNKIHVELQEQQEVPPVGCVSCFTYFAGVYCPATAEEIPAADLFDGGPAKVGQGGRRRRGKVGAGQRSGDGGFFTLTNIPIVYCFEFLTFKGIFVFFKVKPNFHYPSKSVNAQMNRPVFISIINIIIRHNYGRLEQFRFKILGNLF